MRIDNPNFFGGQPVGHARSGTNFLDPVSDWNSATVKRAAVAVLAVAGTAAGAHMLGVRSGGWATGPHTALSQEIRLRGPRVNAWQLGSAESPDAAPFFGTDRCPPHANSEILEKDYLAICSMFRDAEDVDEWLDYHRRVGVGKFYLFDHKSLTPLINTTSRETLSKDDVSYTYFDQQTGPRPQLDVFNECIRRYSQNHAFIAFVDADEYMVPKLGETSIPKILRSFDKAGGLAVYWDLMGSSNHTHRPKSGVVESYTSCLPDSYENALSDNRQYKTIANTKYVASAVTPHVFSYRDNKTAVNDQHQPVEPFYRSDEPSKIRIAIQHYFLKSEDQFRAKAALGGGDGIRRPVDLFGEINAACTRICTHGRDLYRRLLP